MRFLLSLILMFSGVHSAFGDLIGGDVDVVDNLNGVIYLNFDNSRSCTGAKISPNHILTAAHCYTNRSINTLDISLSSDISNNTGFNAGLFWVTPEEYYPYPSYVTAVNLKISQNQDPHSAAHTNSDIAIIKIKTPPPEHIWHKIKTLEVDYNFVGANQNLKVWGYGCEDFAGSNSNLIGRRKSGTTTSLGEDGFHLDHGLTTDFFISMAKFIYPINLPTPGRQHFAEAISICPGDSGGPVTLNGKIVGVNNSMSWYLIRDEATGNIEHNGVSVLNLHTRVSYVKNWMEDIIKNSSPTVSSKPNPNIPNGNNGLFSSTCYSNWDKKNYFLCEGVNSICVSQGRWINIKEMESKAPDMIELCASKNPLIAKMYRSSVKVQPVKIDQNSCWSNFLGSVKTCAGETFICLGNNKWKNLILLTPVEQNKCKSNPYVLNRFFTKR